EIFETIAVLNSTGGNVPRSYFFLDETAKATNYYRLKIVDKDGSYEYSFVAVGNTDCGDSNGGGMTLFPNPMQEGTKPLKVRFYADKEFTKFFITNNLGIHVKYYDLETDLGWNNIHLDLSDLPAGVYYITYPFKKEWETLKFIIVRK
ncbi:MAG: T9SS type A sorting domain-containing protein, partial [Saprospiraceae bacterium]|nr:T9SS type A sorting domain-containing protein [Saprospiraceae bacterium]